MWLELEKGVCVRGGVKRVPRRVWDGVWNVGEVFGEAKLHGWGFWGS